jgi:hypothetical protein
MDRGFCKTVKKTAVSRSGGNFMDVFMGIYTRRSVRDFTDVPVENEKVLEILTAGSWAPSGLNNQPWRFVVVRNGIAVEGGVMAKVMRSA